jgi:hypothetical protein
LAGVSLKLLMLKTQQVDQLPTFRERLPLPVLAEPISQHKAHRGGSRLVTRETTLRMLSPHRLAHQVEKSLCRFIRPKLFLAVVELTQN